MEDWELSWDMKFHPAKCTVLPVTRKQTENKIARYDYQLQGQSLANVTSAQYLGVIMRQDLSWDDHIDSICNRANSTLGFLRRNLRVGATQLKELAYKTFVRPMLEYACTVWDPYTQINIDKLERVQRRAARFVCNRYHRTASVSAMITQLGWTTLQQRRKDARLAMMYKLRHDLVKMDKTGLKPKPARARRGQVRKHNQQYVEDITHTQDYRIGSFLLKTVRDWNNLPQETVDADTLGTFVSRVRKDM